MNDVTVEFVPYDKEEPKKRIVLDPTKCQKIIVPNKGKPRQCKNGKGYGPGEQYCLAHPDG